MVEKIIIVGGGLTGLTLAYRLLTQGHNVTILEGSSQLGGRICTEIGRLGTPLELGATWFSNMHPSLLSLIDELGLTYFSQYTKGISIFQTKSFEPSQEFSIPETDTPSYRLKGGTGSLINELASRIKVQNIRMHSRVKSIESGENGIKVITDDLNSQYAHRVVLCIPPELIAGIKISPALPGELLNVATKAHTWMAGATKFVIEYDLPFWRKAGYSGMLYSHAGIITEMYDHSDCTGSAFALTGFLSSGASTFAKEVRQKLVLDHLEQLFGKVARSYSIYLDKVWNDKLLTNSNQRIELPHQYNGDKIFSESYLEGRLFICGTETSTSCPGYMEGAVVSAIQLSEKLSGI